MSATIATIAANEPWISTVYVEKEQELSHDPLVLSCALKRTNAEDKNNYLSLTSSDLAAKVTDEDRATAEAIREYYCKQWFWASLNGANNLSSFRNRAFYLMSNRIRKVVEQDIGIYYKLPWFYDEDMIYNDLKKNYIHKDLPMTSIRKTTKELMFLRSSQSHQKNRKVERFWFTDDTYLYTITLQLNNPLLEMFRNMIEVGRKSKFDTYVKHDRLAEFEFYTLYNFNFTKE
jgi:hypothetical protein